MKNNNIIIIPYKFVIPYKNIGMNLGTRLSLMIIKQKFEVQTTK